MSVKFLAQGNNGSPLTGFEPMEEAIHKLRFIKIRDMELFAHYF
jgi:hypothetical protein